MVKNKRMIGGEEMKKTIEERVEALEKKIAELEGQVPAQTEKFISEDSNGKHYGNGESKNNS